MFRFPEKNRIAGEPGEPGAFKFKYGRHTIKCIASDREGWEHVSVSLNKLRIPNWEQMCFVKRQFWAGHDWVIQYHPSEDNYVNVHPGVLHLWRAAGRNDYVEKPPLRLV